jgi:hypothetical protein
MREGAQLANELGDVYSVICRTFATQDGPASTIPSAGLTCIHLLTVRLLAADSEARTSGISAPAGLSLDRRLKVKPERPGEGLRWSYNRTVSKYRSFGTLLLIDFGGRRSVARLCGSGYYDRNRACRRVLAILRVGTPLQSTLCNSNTYGRPRLSRYTDVTPYTL